MTQTRLFHDITHLRKSQAQKRKYSPRVMQGTPEREQQDEYIRRNYHRMKDAELGRVMGLSAAAVKNRRLAMSLTHAEAKGGGKQPAAGTNLKRDVLEQRTPEGEIRRMYAAKKAELPLDTPLGSIPPEHRGPALARDLITGAYLLDYEVVISALIS